MIDKLRAVNKKKCVFYYAVVVEGDGKTHRSTPGAREIEPLTLRGEKHGRNPDFCCQEFMVAYVEGEMYVSDRKMYASDPMGKFYVELNQRPASFCPFCGAAMEYREHLKRHSVLTERTVTDYEVQVIEGQ